ncbi:3-phosphoshikimate 1-carboxyvinyltransferase [Lachnoclostridium sp.]|uniref:3-phosphoshikimate 1-carboxyvinyltransferase n=1 Tax=Lachnoclostridium sp. TaxID=2028282 RepID=UPI0028995CC7|nr:3-phosphoshikimate 1-carboxyvinyltransferase [Lachnoclostridium sp.]
MKFHKVKQINGTLTVPGDKSISHRAVMFGALAEGTTEVHNFLNGADCLSTIQCFRQLGISIEEDPEKQVIRIHGKGLHGLTPSSTILDVGNSGTTLRLISGILSGQTFESNLTGDSSIQKRPMNRVITPLSLMNADIKTVLGNGCAPLCIHGSYQNETKSTLKGIHYHSPIASAQVKSSIPLAGLYAEGETSVTEPNVSRNHTELMLKEFGANLTVNDKTVTIQPEPKLIAQNVHVPGDISSAAYFLAATCILPNSELVINNVGVNPTRDGIIDVLLAMGADLTKEDLKNQEGEAVCNLRVRSSKLHGTVIEGSIIPRLIDEIPVIAVVACFAEGDTIIKDAAELKVKESNRIDVMVQQLKHMGANVIATEDGMIIHGGQNLTGTVIDSKEDHRIAMSFAIASLMAEGETTIQGAECVNISYPEFYQDLHRLTCNN